MAHTSYVETTLVENSDDRLALAEEAKRTGEPLQSAAARGSEIVPRDVAAALAQEHSERNTYVAPSGQTFAAQLEPFHEAIAADPEFLNRSNEEKAQAHHEYSAEFERRRQEREAENRRLKAEGYRFDLAVQQANLERAEAFEREAQAYQAARQEFVDEADSVYAVETASLEVINAEQLVFAPSEERAEALRGVTRIPNTDEAAATEALVIKDQIIAIEEPYSAHAYSFEELRPQDAPGEAIVAAAGSPEELVEATALAQLNAGNRTPEAVEAEHELMDEDADPSPDIDADETVWPAAVTDDREEFTEFPEPSEAE